MDQSQAQSSFFCGSQVISILDRRLLRGDVHGTMDLIKPTFIDHQLCFGHSFARVRHKHPFLSLGVLAMQAGGFTLKPGVDLSPVGKLRLRKMHQLAPELINVPSTLVV
jgi:hypothetical protein